MIGIEPVFEKGYPSWEAANRGAAMAETEVTTMDDLMAGINQIMDRLSEIEMILNDPMHGIELPEGVNIDVGEQPTVDMSSTFTVDPPNYNLAEDMDISTRAAVSFRSGGYLNKENMNDT